MKRKSAKHSKAERLHRDWRADLIRDVGHCQLPDCHGLFPYELCVHEIGCGPGRMLSFGQRLACMVVCARCNTYRLTDYSIWPPERQAALQCLLVAHEASPAEVLAVINKCRGRGPNAINWADVAELLEVRLN